MNNNCPVKNIVFDIGMVLVDFRRYDYCRDLGLDEDTTMRLIKGITEHPLWNELDRGAVEYEDINRAFLESEPDMQKQAELFWKDLTANKRLARRSQIERLQYLSVVQLS